MSAVFKEWTFKIVGRSISTIYESYCHCLFFIGHHCSNCDPNQPGDQPGDQPIPDFQTRRPRSSRYRIKVNLGWLLQSPSHIVSMGLSIDLPVFIYLFAGKGVLWKTVQYAMAGAGEKGTLEQGEVQGVHGPLASNDDAKPSNVSRYGAPKFVPYHGSVFWLGKPCE